jgi:hypothetical protein
MTDEVNEMSAASRGSIVDQSWHPIRDAWATLSERMREDRGFAWSVHCNLAMPFQDEGGSREASNRAAARIMDAFFGVDVRGFPEWDFCDRADTLEAAKGVAEQ